MYPYIYIARDICLMSLLDICDLNRLYNIALFYFQLLRSRGSLASYVFVNLMPQINIILPAAYYSQPLR